MLTLLRIKNLALVADLTVELQPGYNAITGETGAGKSIIIGALKLILGERADRSLIRSGAEACSVEAIFNISGLAKTMQPFVEQNGIDPGACEELIIKRSFTASGTNRQFVNGSPVPLHVLHALGDFLVDMHGPHDHQSLLQPARQLAIVDAFGGLEPLLITYRSLLAQRRALLERKAGLIVDERTYAQQLDLLRFQVREIAGAKLQPGEEELLENDFRKASNAARLVEAAQAALEVVSEGEGSVLELLGKAGRHLQELARLDRDADPISATQVAAIELLSDLQRQLSSYSDAIEIDPARLAELTARVDLVHSLKRKYGASIAEIIQFGNNARERLQALESRDEELEKLHAEIKSTETQLRKAARELTEARRKLLPKLGRLVSHELQELGFKESHFEIQLNSDLQATLSNNEDLFGETGVDKIEFLFGPNPGEPLKSLRVIASSGELARVMLGLKTVLAAQDEVPVLVFDEVDANVGGETATVVGEKMQAIGKNRQVLCITHLAPVAAAAPHHYVVTKETQEGRTISQITPLEPSARVSELARMLGGQSDEIRKHAGALLRPRTKAGR